MLIGKNIRLKSTTTEHAQLLADWMSDPGVLGEFFNIWPETRQKMERRITRRGEHAEDETEQFLICAIGNDEAMGVIGYFSPFTNKRTFKGVELYYVIHPNFRRSRIATQAVCLVVNHLFDATPIERIQATVVVGNEHSCRVLRRAGMKKEGTYRRVTFLHGGYADVFLYSIVREDWENESVYRKSRPEF